MLNDKTETRNRSALTRVHETGWRRSFRRGSQWRQSIARAALRGTAAAIRRAPSFPSELITGKLRTALEPGSTKCGISQMQTERTRLSPYFGLVRMVSFGSSTILLIPAGAD